MASTKIEIESRRKDEPQIGRDDDWDDSALIAAYDKAMNKAKVEVARKKNIPYSAPVKNGQKSKKKQKWSIGDFCQAVFSEDGLSYEAVINEIDESNDSCTVLFVGYGNEEEVPLSSLAPSLGRSNRQKQEEMAKPQGENGDCDDAESSSYSEEETVRRNRVESNKTTFQDAQPPKEDPVAYHRCFANRHAHHHHNVAPITCPPPPPPMPTPPPFLVDRVGPEDDKLYSMLLSWYMSGYHTGFYMGSRQAQSSPSHLRNMYNYYGP